MKQKKTKKTIRAILLCLAVLYLYNNFFMGQMLNGRYANTNFKFARETNTPYNPDTLVIQDGRYTSRFYGQGHVELSYSLSGTKISLRSNSPWSSMFYETHISRSYFFGTPIISLNSDFNQYYIKILEW